MDKNGQKSQADFMDAHKKNLEAISEANRLAVDVMQSLAKLQSDYMRRTFDDMSSFMNEFIKNPSSVFSGKAPMENDHFKNMMDTTLHHGTQVADVVGKTNTKVFNLSQERLNDMLESFKDAPFKYKN